LSDKDQIKDLFSEKLGNFEAKVSPDLWANVVSQVGAASGAAATGGMSLLTKAIIGISGAAVVTTGVVFYTSSNSETPEPKTKETVLSTDTPSQEKEKETAKEDPKTFVVENSPTNINGANTVELSVVTNSPVQNSNGIEPQAPGLDPLGNNGTTLANNPDPKTDPKEPVSNGGTNNSTPTNNNMPLDPNETVTQEDKPIMVSPVDITETQEVREEIRVIMPNVFTPNGDRYNDDYFVKESNVDFEMFEFVVYNNRGEEVFQTSDPEFKWDGRDKRSGEYVQLDNNTGVFAYFITATTTDGRGFTASNVITINR
jgi:gliding motility-associated-like protein